MPEQKFQENEALAKPLPPLEPKDLAIPDINMGELHYYFAAADPIYDGVKPMPKWEHNPEEKGIWQQLVGRYRAPVFPEEALETQLKKVEEESNLIRIDLDKVCKDLVDLEHSHLKEGTDEYLEVYDRYYTILFKSKA